MNYLDRLRGRKVPRLRGALLTGLRLITRLIVTFPGPIRFGIIYSLKLLFCIESQDCAALEAKPAQ
jgi:hypothetical protein